MGDQLMQSGGSMPPPSPVSAPTPTRWLP